MSDQGNKVRPARQVSIHKSNRGLAPTGESTPDLPKLVATACDAAHFAYEEFFCGRVRNLFTRKNYRLAVHRLLEGGRHLGLELHQIAPKHVGQYLHGLPHAAATRKVLVRKNDGSYNASDLQATTKATGGARGR